MFLANVIAFISGIIAVKANIVLITTVLIIFNIFVGAKYLCITIQRLHDIGRSGHHYWLLFIPIYNLYLNILLLFKKGTDGPSEYSYNPHDLLDNSN